MPAEMRDFMVALMMLSNQLKEIAATYNVFISTSTQVNGDGLRPEEKRDQRVLRGSKAIADKVDVAMIVEKLEPEAMEKVQSYISQVRRAPTHLTTIYKIRSGTRKGIRIYSYINLGNGERQDLFLTDENNKLVVLEDYEKIAAFPLVSLPIINDTVLNNLSN